MLPPPQASYVPEIEDGSWWFGPGIWGGKCSGPGGVWDGGCLFDCSDRGSANYKRAPLSGQSLVGTS